MAKREFPPIHPGEILLEEFLKPMGISQYRLAKDISVDPRRINEIVHGKRRITADTALRLSRYFDMPPQFWLGLQMDYDLDAAADKLAHRLEKEVGVSVASRPYPTRAACTFQSKKGQIVLDQIRTVDKVRLVRKLGQIKKAAQGEVLDVLVEMFADG